MPAEGSIPRDGVVNTVDSPARAGVRGVCDASVGAVQDPARRPPGGCHQYPAGRKRPPTVTEHARLPRGPCRLGVTCGRLVCLPEECALNVSAWVWVATLVALTAILLFDLLIIGRRPHEPSVRESSLWVVFYVALAAALRRWALVSSGRHLAGQFYAGWLTEYSLSVDNLFVFVIIMARFAVPRAVPAEGAAHRHRAGAGHARRLHRRRRRAGAGSSGSSTSSARS